MSGGGRRQLSAARRGAANEREPDQPPLKFGCGMGSTRRGSRSLAGKGGRASSAMDAAPIQMTVDDSDSEGGSSAEPTAKPVAARRRGPNRRVALILTALVAY
jgi:hypothetical protein